MFNDNDDMSYKKIIAVCILMASAVIMLFLFILVYNDQQKHNKIKEERRQKALEEQQLEEERLEDEQLNIGKNNLTSQDLDFWDMYDTTKDQLPEDDKVDKSKRQQYKDNIIDSLEDSSLDETENTDNSAENTDETENSPYNDGKHIKVTSSDGKETYYEIMDDVDANNYDLDKYIKLSNDRLVYTNPSVRSFFGIDVSKYQGDIDFSKVKNAGVDYIMARVAYRGSTTGQIALDDKFVANASGAKAAGIPIGVYFCSGAATELEAIEEANFTAAAISNFGITYPVALDIEDNSDVNSRTYKLTAKERTACIKAYMETIRNFGYNPVLYASRDMLVSGIDLGELTDCDIWLSDCLDSINNIKSVQSDEYNRSSGSSSSSEITSERKSRTNVSKSKTSNDLSSLTENQSGTDKKSDNYQVSSSAYTDFPYNFTMWQYSSNGTVDGISKNVDLNLCFKNYLE